MRWKIAIIGLLAGSWCLVGRAGELQKPLYTEVILRSGHPSSVSGHLLRYDEQTLVVRSGKTERTLRWVDLTASTAFTLRSRLIDKSKAGDWMALGTFGWGVGAKEQARAAFARAVRLDAGLKAQAEAVLASEAGTMLTASSGDQPASTTEPAGVQTAPTEQLPRAGHQGAEPTETAVKYLKSTPEQDKAAIETARTQSQSIGQELKLSLAEIQTAHFLIFTDWDPREYDFLKTNLEGAYAAVSRQFDIPVKENVFVGKLPVYMLARQADFLSFANRIDHFPANEQVAGYYWGRTDGIGHLVMWKPDLKMAGNNVRVAEVQWAYVLTHEFTHAFVARYRTNAPIVTWLNEGVAEVIASSQFPRPGARQAAARMARAHQSIAEVFTEAHPSGEWYPVMRTLAETLIARDRKAFLTLFDDLKEGMPVEEALQKDYHWTLPMLEAAWRQYVRQFEVRRGGR